MAAEVQEVKRQTKIEREKRENAEKEINKHEPDL